MWTEHYLYLAVIIPLFGTFINGMNSYFGNRMPKKLVGIIGCSSVFISLLISLRGFYELTKLPQSERIITNIAYKWIQVGNVDLDVGFLLDPLSAVMALVVSGVGFLIHVYSIGYMWKDAGFSRFFAYLNLFIFSMMLLVLGNNLLLMFVGWDGVGLCSYLLIGFWFHHMPNAVAGMKAFIVNRIGDYGFLVGIMLLFVSLGMKGHWTLTFTEMKEYAPLLGAGGIVTAIAVCLFIGAVGKSAQIPLYVWLPDAMAGPTPVSSLIHAATMVTAGVYMIGRLNFIFAASPTALLVVAVVGAATAIFAASIGLAQNDIKKVLAYSTVSQLGFMFLAMGVAAFAAGIFHLMTHAFFKGLLFLAAGSVIHAMSNEQDMRFMGGLKGKIPVTYWTFMLATLAIVGVFPFAGFFSKDEILWKTWESGHHGLWLIGFIAAGFTAFYMFRLAALTFFGENRADHDTQHHIHESPKVMLIPLAILAALSVIGGWIGIPEALGGSNHFHHWLAPVFSHGGGHGHAEAVSAVQAAHGTIDPAHAAAASHDAASALAAHGNAVQGTAAEAEHAPQSGHGGALEVVFAALSLTWALLCASLGFFLYRKRIDIVDRLKNMGQGLVHRLVENKYYVDEIYDLLFVKNLLRLVRTSGRFDLGVIDGAVDGVGWLTKAWAFFSGLFDLTFVDGLVNGVANITRSTGQRLRSIQSGQIQGYLYFLFTLVVVILFLQWIL